MKTRNLILGIAGLVIAAGCAMQVRNGQPDPHTKYIVKFENPDHDASPIASAVTNTLLVEQDSQVNPNSQHVTQRVGFNRGQEKSLAELLEFVKQ